MEKESALHQLMDIRMNGVMNGSTNSNGKYQEIIQKSDKYSGKLDKLNLPKEIRLLIDRHVSEQNALDSRYGILAYLLGSSDCREILMGKCLFAETKEMVSKKNTHVQNQGKGLY